MGEICLIKWGTELKFEGTLTGMRSRWDYSDGVRSKWADNRHYGTSVSSNYWLALRGFLGYVPNIMWGLCKDGSVVVEATKEFMGQTTTQVVVLDSNGILYAGETADGMSYSPYKVRTDVQAGCNGTAILCALIKAQMEDDEAESLLRQEQDGLLRWGDDYNFSSDEMNRLAKVIALLGDNFYRRSGGKCVAGTPMIAEVPESNDDINPLDADILKGYLLAEVRGAEPKYAKLQSSKPTAGKVAQGGTKDRPSIDLTFLGDKVYDASTGLVPAHVPSWHEWRDYEISLARRIALSYKYAAAMQVFAFIGPAGCGKTEAVTAIADLLGRAKVVLSCQPETDVEDIWGRYVPKVGAGGVEYEFVEGPLTTALRHGCVLEIQEVGLVRRAGVMAALNDVLESSEGRLFKLATGEWIEKSKDFIVAFTSNDGYEGTNLLNQSVLSRMSEVFYFDNPSEDTMAARTKEIVNDFPSDTELKKMAKCISQISEACHAKGIDDGVCGQRELTGWAMTCMLLMAEQGKTKLTSDIIREAAQSAVLNKASQNREDIVALGFETLNKHYGDFAATVVG